MKADQITNYINILPFLKRYLGKLPDPPLDPVTKEVIQPELLAKIFPRVLVEQEMSLEEKIPIPDAVRELYQLFRPTPLIRATRLEKILKTPAQLFYKYEGATLSGSHKINTALAQAYYNKEAGTKMLITETGAGQWGSALAMACSLFQLKCSVFMVSASFYQKPYRKEMMRLFGAQVVASPSRKTGFGKQVLARDGKSTGSLGIAISEAMEMVSQTPGAKYALGSVLNHVLLHQTVIGQELQQQCVALDIYPDVLVGCVGGGSNFYGFIAPFMIERLHRNTGMRFVAVEAQSVPKMTKGTYRYDFGDTAGKTPLLKMETLGADFIPAAIHAGGLRYHGNAPILSLLHREGLVEAKAVSQIAAFKAGVMFARCEGLIPAPESSHAICVAIAEAIKAREEKKKRVIVMNISGHGLLDMQGYHDYFARRLV